MSAIKPSAKRVKWIFTLNNYGTAFPLLEAFDKRLQDFPATALYQYGQEVAPTTGTPHLQGYIEFKPPGASFTAVKNLIPGANIEQARGDRRQNLEYTAKDGAVHRWSRTGDSVFSTTKRGAQGQRNDLIALRNLISDGKTLDDLIMDDEHISYVSRYKIIPLIAGLYH